MGTGLKTDEVRAAMMMHKIEPERNIDQIRPQCKFRLYIRTTIYQSVASRPVPSYSMPLLTGAWAMGGERNRRRQFGGGGWQTSLFRPRPRRLTTGIAPLSQAAFKLASFLRQSRLPHAFENRLELGEIPRIVAHRCPGGAGAGDCEGRVERETSLGRRPRLVRSAKLREGDA